MGLLRFIYPISPARTNADNVASVNAGARTAGCSERCEVLQLVVVEKLVEKLVSGKSRRLHCWMQAVPE